jgi:DNA-binding NarL/FixJ family response regulator
MARHAEVPFDSIGQLTAFERRTLELMASGLDRHQIGRLLNRAPKTISNCLTDAKEKLGARSLAEAAALVSKQAPINHPSGEVKGTLPLF